MSSSTKELESHTEPVSQDIPVTDAAAPAASHVDPRTVTALEFMAAEYRRPNLRLADVARRVHLSQWHLDRLLMRDTGHGFRYHVRDIRQSHVRRLLHTSLAIKEIAEASGYNYVTVMGRHFVARHGVTPSQYRRRVRQSASNEH